MVSSSAYLFHGPGAYEEALQQAEAIGRLLCAPIQDAKGGFKTAQARLMVEKLSNAPIGDQIGVVLGGPLDDARPSATDVLLKTLEEFNDELVHPVLWAVDAERVNSTILSRCEVVWCPFGQAMETEFLDEAVKLVQASLSGDYGTVVEVVRRHKGKEYGLMAASAMALLDAPPEKGLPLWEKVRRVLMVPNPTPTETLVAFL